MTARRKFLSRANFAVTLGPRRIAFGLLLVGALGSVPTRASPPQLPELRVDLTDIGAQQCREVAWSLPHSVLLVLACHIPAAATGTTVKPASLPVNAPELRRQALAWQEMTVNPPLANAILTMQSTLDALPRRSLRPEWRILIGQGVFGCKLRVDVSDDGMRFTDPCNPNRYDADGRAMGSGYPDLAIPPYVIEDRQLILGRMPASLTIPEALPAPTFGGPSSPSEQLLRAARWGRIDRAAELLGAGADVNATIEGGNTALLTAIQLRQQDMVEFLLAKGADVHLGYRDGTTPLDIARMVNATELEEILLRAGARAGENKALEQHQ